MYLSRLEHIFADIIISTLALCGLAHIILPYVQHNVDISSMQENNICYVYFTHTLIAL